MNKKVIRKDGFFDIMAVLTEVESCLLAENEN